MKIFFVLLLLAASFADYDIPRRKPGSDSYEYYNNYDQGGYGQGQDYGYGGADQGYGDMEYGYGDTGYGYEDTDYGYGDTGYGYGYPSYEKYPRYPCKPKLIPASKKCCKCIYKIGYKCCKVKCCQVFDVIYKKYPVPSLAKPKGGK